MYEDYWHGYSTFVGRHRDISRDMAKLAAKGGHVDVLKWLHEKGEISGVISKVIMDIGAEGGHIDIMDFCLENGCTADENTAEEAARSGNLQALKWLRSHGECPWRETYKKYDWGNRSNDLHYDHPSFGSSILSSAGWGGNVAMLKWLREESAPNSGKGYLDDIIIRGHWDALIWAHQDGWSWGEEKKDDKGKTEYWSNSAMMKAVIFQGLDVLQWLRSIGCPWDSEAYNNAAAFAPLETMVWMRKNGCPWNEPSDFGLDTYGWVYGDDHSAFGDSLNKESWLHDMGCPGDFDGHPKIVRAEPKTKKKKEKKKEKKCNDTAESSKAAERRKMASEDAKEGLRKMEELKRKEAEARRKGADEAREKKRKRDAKEAKLKAEQKAEEKRRQEQARAKRASKRGG